MISSYSAETASPRLDEGAWKALSCDEAKSLLRIFPGVDAGRGYERTFSSVLMIAQPNGQDLYVRPHLFG